MLRPSHPAKVTSLWKTVQDGYVQHKGVGTLWSLGQEEGAWECTYNTYESIFHFFLLLLWEKVVVFLKDETFCKGM